MLKRRFGAAALVLAGIVVGCGGNTLAGTWSFNPHAPDISSITLTLNGDGTETVSTNFTGSCSGSCTETGYMWSSTATTLTTAGNPSLTGTVTCAGKMVQCSASPVKPINLSGTCNFVLSNADNPLTLDMCTNSTTPPDGGGDAGSGSSTSYTFTRSSS